MKIRVADKNIGECVINTYVDIPKSVEYVVKSLCVLQLTCLNTNQSDPNFDIILDILKNTTERLCNLYNNEECNEPDPFEQFKSNNS